MTSPEAQAILILCSLIFTVLTVFVGVGVRTIVKWTRIEDKLATLTEDMADVARNETRAHTELVEQMREDRKATNDRLTYLERFVWPVTSRRRPG